MNREIKFRGWNGKRWTREYKLNEMLVEQLKHNGLKENWIQYTGLHDKNGKEIYEGDVLQDVANSNHVVEYDKGHYIVRHDNGTGDFIAPINKFEVIGNIYTNLELVGADIG